MIRFGVRQGATRELVHTLEARRTPRSSPPLLRTAVISTSRGPHGSFHFSLSRARRSDTVFKRHASTSADGAPKPSRLLDLLVGATLVLGAGIFYFYITDTRASAHRYIIIPTLRLFYPDPEDAHQAGNHILKALWDFGLHPRERGDFDADKGLEVEVFGQLLRNPLATSAGIDKQAEIPDALFEIGPAIVEIGGTTPMPQDGNEKPRVFRLTSQQAMINRYGLNSEGADYVAMKLRNRVRKFAHSLGLGQDEIAEKAVLDGIAGVPPGSLTPGKLLAVNIAKNKFTPENDVEAVTNDYVYCVETLGPYADILVVNVSSPNTPGLRSLQEGDKLKRILGGVVEAAHKVERRTRPFVMVKVSPDEDSDEQIAGICDAVWASGVDGVVVGNTTNRRPEALSQFKSYSPLEQQNMLERGGFSGPHLFEGVTALVKKYRKHLAERPPGIQKPDSLPARKGALKADADAIRGSLAARTETGADTPPEAESNKVTASVDSGVVPVNGMIQDGGSAKQPLINLPTDRLFDKSPIADDKSPATDDKSPAADGNSQVEKVPAPDPGVRDVVERRQLRSIQEAIERLPPKAQRDALERLESPGPHLGLLDQPKAIFATGGITNGRQALEVLNAGANVAMVYTALVYGGVGTISRIKDEMREEMGRQAQPKGAMVPK
ncbi:dihydroorotate dehydrogenase (fumarate) [Cladophialophora yegresii CBS 114405]|uniref:Dihydroorotate dehydrogenase (quinone), mitochondrial n=1 Tax=Cladophialophora yegresii CBS 114405 TaxID=1182544 RepID=W9W097_9EURO|nr:dihydroorotate dehydrogenase (fumarate) [Cladophialophora yegresii CBS 114405]EXJ58385.1 dihydroorotate dehydrogenase (fumarate) [Cladophialophora yegresii CBS 114405]